MSSTRQTPSTSGEDTIVSTKIPFGKALAKEFLFDPAYRNLNHGIPLSPSPSPFTLIRSQH